MYFDYYLAGCNVIASSALLLVITVAYFDIVANLNFMTLVTFMALH
jgi:hypothetical protein